ncbi:hypothetical protein COO60DRAFT_25604 [Scenedesmus sp. NREL 46B-D3]|nr:hypothetical protein COO60DRAFT_25604 [Scenedesmus sp. NREL 46B-D3]
MFLKTLICGCFGACVYCTSAPIRHQGSLMVILSFASAGAGSVASANRYSIACCTQLCTYLEPRSRLNLVLLHVLHVSEAYSEGDRGCTAFGWAAARDVLNLSAQADIDLHAVWGEAHTPHLSVYHMSVFVAMVLLGCSQQHLARVVLAHVHDHGQPI